MQTHTQPMAQDIEAVLDFKQQLDRLRYRARHASSYLERKTILTQIGFLHRRAGAVLAQAETSDRAPLGNHLPGCESRPMAMIEGFRG